MLLGGLVLTICTVLAGLALWIATLNRRAIRRIEARQNAELLRERDELARQLAAPSRGRHLRVVKPPTFAAVGAAMGAAWGLTRRHPGLALGGLAAVTASGIVLTPSYSQAPQPPAHGVHTTVPTSQVAASAAPPVTPRRARPTSVPASTRPEPSTPVTSVPASTRTPPAVLAGTPTTTTSMPASSTPLLTSAVDAVTSAVDTVTAALPSPICRIKVLDRCVREVLPTLP
jgi:hypothetical protein